jgi:hypothetical protein
MADATQGPDSPTEIPGENSKPNNLTWVKPTLQRLSLKDAYTSLPAISNDGCTTGS